MSLEIIPVWKEVTPELEAELAEFWATNQIITDAAQAAARAKWVVCVARCGQGALVGVSTVLPRVMPRLRQPMYYYRNFIVADFREQPLAASFLARTREVLQEYNLALPAPRCLGIVIEHHDQPLTAGRHEAQWQEGPVFIGYSPKGLPLRAWYFEGARLFAPAPIGRKVIARAH